MSIIGSGLIVGGSVAVTTSGAEGLGSLLLVFGTIVGVR